MDYLSQLLLICPLLLVAGIIDGVSGGGGIIALPTYIMAGLPLNIAYGCNKMQSCLGTAAGLIKYAKNGFVDIKAALIASITAILGSHISTKIFFSGSSCGGDSSGNKTYIGDSKMYDLIIKNGSIIDGSGSPPFLSNIAVKNGKIAKIGKNIKNGEKVIDAKGLTVTPGFIDSHSHSDRQILTFPNQTEKTEQGITTSIGGQCGGTNAPISRDITPENAQDVAGFGKETDVYRTMGTFLNIAKNVPLGSNIAVLVGHRALRKAVMSTENRKPTVEEMTRMKNLLREGIEHGAKGLSFGLIYSPSCYAEIGELIELAKVVGEYKGIVAAHIRNERETLIDATAEFIKMVTAANVRGVLSHHKAMGKENWGKVKTTLKMIDEANKNGADIYCDVYPYTASNTSLSSRFIPKELHAGGSKKLAEILSDPKGRKKIIEWNLKLFGEDLSYVMISDCSAYPQYEGLRIPEIAELHGKDGYNTLLDLIKDSKNNCRASFFAMCEEDIETVISHPRAMICTDSGVAGNSKTYHPRLRGSFPRVLGRYVRERKVVPLPEMIRKMTSLPAAVYELKGKGLIQEGMDADICIFDSERIKDNADYNACGKRAEGLNYVIINGEIVAENAVHNGKRPSRVILKNT